MSLLSMYGEREKGGRLASTYYRYEYSLAPGVLTPRMLTNRVGPPHPGPKGCTNSFEGIHPFQHIVERAAEEGLTTT
jgi:hypothetical protein